MNDVVDTLRSYVERAGDVNIFLPTEMPAKNLLVSSRDRRRSFIEHEQPFRS